MSVFQNIYFSKIIFLMSRIKNPNLPYLHKIIITTISLFIVLLILWPADKPKPLESRPDTRYEIGKTYSVAIEAKNLLPQEIIPTSYRFTDTYLEWKDFSIRSGESLALVFDRAGISPTTLHQLMNTDKHTKSLASLKVGDEIQLGFDEEGRFSQLTYSKNITETLVVTRVNDGFISRIDSKQTETQIAFASANIQSSFWNAGVKADLKPNQIMELATIFGWDIDFALDIRRGDSFSVLYEKNFIEGDLIGQGNILAATFTNQGDTFTAIRYKSGKYYDENGLAMRKTFLRSPVNFRYVSSNFNPYRQHPVTGKITAHNGTDYVAPVGTPIWAAGDGTVTESSYSKYNGNYVFIRHNATYYTKYLHLTKRSVKQGDRVKQGQTIGTLGATGRVTGAHLHYEFLVNGTHKNPRTVQLPKSRSLFGNSKTEFMALSKTRLAQLNRLNQLFASTQSPEKDKS